MPSRQAPLKDTRPAVSVFTVPRAEKAPTIAAPVSSSAVLS